jgi:hypothetical protein
VERKNPFHPYAINDPTDGEGGGYAAAVFFRDNKPLKCSDPLFIPLFDFLLYPHRIAGPDFRGIAAQS